MKRACTFAVLSALAVAVVSSGASFAGTVVYVNGTTGNDANTGADWTTAKKTVTAGLAAAVSGDQVWVAAGTYVERITLTDGVGLYGGFAGGETDLTQRSWTANTTILDGNQVGCVVTSPAGATATTQIDGFTIRNSGTYQGGGILCSSSSPTITNNTICGNTSSYYGGGISCRSSSPVISDNKITGNCGPYGGGIYCALASSPTITNNTISDNRSTYQGGGIYCSSSSPTITNNAISENIADRSAGGIYCSSCSPTIMRNTISGNSTGESGGGIYCSSASPAIQHNTIVGNAGSGIECYPSSSPAITNNTIAANGGPGIMCRSSTSPVITNNTILANAMAEGGGIRCAAASPTISNNIVAFNSSGIYNSGGTPVLRNNDVYNPGGSNYFGLSAGSGDISADPQVAPTAYGQFHLQPGSLCADAGWNDAPGVPATDMDAEPRVQNGTIDIGADEYNGTSVPAVIPLVVRASTSGDDANDGSSWTLAKRTVQSAIDAAAGQGGEVWVASGTYVGGITLKAYVSIYGGFAGAEAERQERDWTANRTILDGNGTGRVVTASMIGHATSAIDGFTIRNGKASHGAGVYCPYSSPTVSNNMITGNDGGAVYCFYSAAVIVNNTIAGNTLSLGGGGGIYCAYSSAAMISNNVISNNSASSGGGIYCDASSLTLTNNTIVGNSASQGGGIWCSSASPAISNNIVAFNSSGIYSSGGTPVLHKNDVYNPGGDNYSGLAAGMDDMSADPVLVAVQYGQFRLQAGSPCVDSGSNDATSFPATDMDGEPRVQNGTVDIGADEYNGTPPPLFLPLVVHVSPSGDDANDGSRWDLAKRTVQAGIDATAAQGGEVWVAAGTYVERTTLKTYVYVYGGFAGTEGQRSARDWAANVTILDGNQAGSVVTGSLIGYRMSTIDGFTIRNGKATYGGGIYCSSASPTISHNNITGNSESGVYCSLSSPLITDNQISGNSGDSGAGVYCSSSSPTIANNTITGNRAYIRGGGVYSSDATAILNNTISGNTAGSYGGGVYCASSVPVSGNVITANTANYGGGLFCASSAPISNNTIMANTGSGIYCCGSSPTIVNNRITGNSGTTGGGIWCCCSSSATITNNTIIANIATQAGGIFSDSSSPTISNNIVAFNSSGIYRSGGTPVLRNNDVYNPDQYDYSGLAAGTGDISTDPKLLSVDHAEIHLQAGSVCIDTGWNQAPGLPATDMDGETRVQNGTVDIGADEYNGTPPAAFQPPVVRVSTSGDDANDGSRWDLAKRTVQAAIDAATVQGGDVWVAAGTHVGRLTLKPCVFVYGGFSGNEVRRSERNWIANVTILDGNQTGSVVSVSSLPGYRMCAIDGFTIRNGKASDGGGIHITDSSPQIANNTITANTASYLGGGVYCSGSSATVSRNWITRNASSQGGGVYLTTSSLVMANNTISGNKAQMGGGALCDSGSPGIISNVVSGNTASANGGGIYCRSSTALITNNTITANMGVPDGGGIYCSSSSPAISNNIVAFNSSGIYSSGGTPLLRNNDVYNPDRYDYSGLAPGTGDVSADPRLNAVAYGQVHLEEGSPCIGAGWNDAPGLPAADVDGEPRIQNGTVEIGADEYNGTPPPTFVPPVVRVSPSGNDANDGSTWARAKRTVQAGIDAAPNGSDVWVAAGTYVELVTLKTYAHLYGGFSGNETQRSERDWHANATTIDANQAGCAVTASWIVYGTSTIDGFTIRNGKNRLRQGGAGIHCSYSSPIIANNRLTGNGSPAMYCGNASPVVMNNAIVENSGAAILFDTASTATISNNTIANNAGAGLSCSSTAPVISNNIVAFNSSGVSGSGTSAVLHANDVYNPGGSNYTGISAGTDDISADPLFLDQAGGDYRLAIGSPCIDGGWNPAVGLPATDLDGGPRIVRGTVDIGAYEFIPGDFGRDGDVDMDDFGHFRDCYNGPNRTPGHLDCSDADADGDNDVDLLDFAVFRNCFNGANRPPACP